MSALRITVRVLAAASAFVASGSEAQEVADSIVELNRSGQWSKAVVAAERVLAQATTTIQIRCETLSQMTYALGRLQRGREARLQAENFKHLCSTLPPNHWSAVEVARTLALLDSLSAGVVVGRRASTTDDWALAAPAALGLDTSVLRAHRELCERSGADACLVVRQGALVDEWYGSGYSEPMMAMSSTKSVTGLLVGILAADGNLSIDDPVSRFIPEWRAGTDAGVRIRHLLSMTSGLPDNRIESDVSGVTDKESFAFGLPLSLRPGESWAYTNNGAFLLSPLIRRAAREPVADFAMRRLFLPLGMHQTRMHVYPEGQAWTHADMETTARDFARIGQLMLDKGKWRGTQVVPEEWVELSTRQSQPFARYGLLWWLDVEGGFAARGYLDTNLYIFPSRELVIVRMQAKPRTGALHYEPEAQELFARMLR